MNFYNIITEPKIKIMYNNLIFIKKISVVLSVVFFVLGFISLWFFLPSFIFGSAAAVCELLKNAYKD